MKFNLSQFELWIHIYVVLLFIAKETGSATEARDFLF